MSDPWVETFRDDPDQAVADLFSGRAGVGSSLRLDVPELLYQAFPSNRTDERTQLDDALWKWLIDMRESYADQVRRLGFPVYGKRLCDALIALQLLDLPETRSRVRADLNAWLRWLIPLRLAPERDPALECLRLLTRGQRDTSHTALWLRLAADPRPEYLAVALAGLQSQPNQGDAWMNQVLMLQALLRHAVKVRHETSAARKFFNRDFAALRGLFPRAPRHWNRSLNEALDGFVESVPERMASELAETLRGATAGGHRRSSAEQASPHEPATRKRVDQLKADIRTSRHPPEILAERFFALLDQNHRHAEATGTSHFFVRTLHNLGTRLLRHYRLGEDEMARFGLMIERALAWEPANPYCWTLWADWFETRGYREAHEWTLREMLRLFPNNEHSRVELARLLLRQGEHHRDEAEHWLRQAATLDPLHKHARVELARLLIRRGERHWDEAEHWLRQVVERDPDNEHSRVVMARLLVLRHRSAEAETLLAEFVERHPANAAAQRSLDRLRSGIHSAEDDDTLDEARENGAWVATDRGHLTTPPSAAPPELVHRGRLAGEFSRARIAKARGDAVLTDRIEEETRKGDPLAGFYYQWLMPDRSPDCPPHAWAWNACRLWQGHRQDSARSDGWQDLAERFPEAAMETAFLRDLAAPDDGDGLPSGMTDWCARYSPDGDTPSRPVVAFMREGLERLDETGSPERDELALAVLACTAVGAPEFASVRTYASGKYRLRESSGLRERA